MVGLVKGLKGEAESARKEEKARQTSLNVGENTPTGRSSAENRQRSPISDLHTIDPGNMPVTSPLPDAPQKNPVPFFLTVGVSNRDMYRKSGQTVGPQLVGLAADRGGPVELPRVPQSPPVTVSSGQQSCFPESASGPAVSVLCSRYVVELGRIGDVLRFAA